MENGFVQANLVCAGHSTSPEYRGDDLNDLYNDLRWPADGEQD